MRPAPPPERVIKEGDSKAGRVNTSPTAALPGKPLTPPEAPAAETWFRSILTDREGNFDAGAVLSCIVVLFMCLASGWATIVLKLPFNAQDFGIGIAGVLGGFAAYKVSDTKRPPVAAAAGEINAER